MNPCEYCENGVSDYNGRIVCKKKYVFPSFQEYSYQMFNKMKQKQSLNIEVISSNMRPVRIVCYAILLLLFSIIWLFI